MLDRTIKYLTKKKFDAFFNPLARLYILPIQPQSWYFGSRIMEYTTALRNENSSK